ncbi:MAG: hypothetical protein CVV42_07970 [Candidatus Riflebacteria bacterium HGW-Riflebacteria-2]|jgi:DNA-dependent RNA polymerase auxiliary subunit epsilon|nr:MAG: hypothetical protein CVV42_07970 [Candidatus Riflebacteria bacterium HGW-Riflebacteria-2]
MDAHEKKILEYKRKIISLMRSREHSSALKLYHKTFTAESPADPEFLESFYIELNKVNMHEVAFETLQEATAWHPDNEHVEELYKNATGIYFDNLVLHGNNLLFERDDKETKFTESIKKADSLAREKMREENDKILAAIVHKAMETYRKALELREDSVPALSGLMRCHQILGENELVEEINARIEELSPALRSREKSRQELAREAELAEEERKREAARELEMEESAVENIRKLFQEKKYHDVIQQVDELHLSYRTTVPLLLLKARSFAELRRFKAADQTIIEAEQHNRNINEVLEIKNSINETKYGILCKAADVYLHKALELGLSLGEGHFRKAQKCLVKSLEYVPENIDLLDKLYTTQKYLGEREDSYKTKAMIYVLNKKYVTAFDRESSASLCFIASFAYEGEPAIINDFRWFRREFLLTSRAGMALNCLYIRFSPAVTVSAAKFSFSRPLFRTLLYPVRLMIGVLQQFIC